MSKLDLIIEKILVFLICSLPILLITGSFLPDFILSLASLIFIYYIYKKKNFYILNNNFTKIFIIFWIFLIISSINSENFKTSIFTSFFYIRFLIFTLIVCYLFNNSQNFIKYLFKILLISIIILILFGFIELITNSNFLDPKNNPAITSLFGERGLLGSYLSRFLPFLIGLYFLNYSKNKFNFKILLLIFLSALFILLSNQRITIIYFFIFFIFLTYFSKNKIKQKIYLILFCLLSLTLLIVFIPSLNNRLIKQTLSQSGNSANNYYYETKNYDGSYTAIVGSKNFYLFSLKHEVLFKNSIKIFINNPLLGSGPNTFKYICKNEKYYKKYDHPAFNDLKNKNKNFFYEGFTDIDNCSTHPHNIYLQILSETGIGIIFLIIFFIYILKKIILSFKNINIYSNFFLCSIFISVFPFVTTGNFFNNWLSILCFFPIGMILNEKK